ncbi:hypothetical protein T10_12998 [Trichinella papuae]|uniref:Uncharacterized protein n=1 Tax=Trichinella papuae TaxID=268474 RepID=A0A0V1MRS3_9BILA|nr:hypothetical protein T10_12998 [Trichinella papuae]
MMWECRRTPANYLHARISSTVPLTMVVRNCSAHTVNFGRQSAVLIEHTLLHILVSWTVRSGNVREYGWFVFNRLGAAEIGHASSKLRVATRKSYGNACDGLKLLYVGERFKPLKPTSASRIFDIEAISRVCGPPSCSLFNQLVIFIRHRWCHCSASPPPQPPILAQLI